MKIYTLTVVRETQDRFADAETTLYANPEEAIEAYNQAFDEATREAQEYGDMWQDHEIATDTPYRWWRVADMAGTYDVITIELDTKEVM